MLSAPFLATFLALSLSVVLCTETLPLKLNLTPAEQHQLLADLKEWAAGLEQAPEADAVRRFVLAKYLINKQRKLKMLYNRLMDEIGRPSKGLWRRKKRDLSLRPSGGMWKKSLPGQVMDLRPSSGLWKKSVINLRPSGGLWKKSDLNLLRPNGGLWKRLIELPRNSDNQAVMDLWNKGMRY